MDHLLMHVPDNLTHTHTHLLLCVFFESAAMQGDLAQLRFGSGADPRTWRKSVVIQHDWKLESLLSVWFQSGLRRPETFLASPLSFQPH